MILCSLHSSFIVKTHVHIKLYFQVRKVMFIRPQDYHSVYVLCCTEILFLDREIMALTAHMRKVPHACSSPFHRDRMSNMCGSREGTGGPDPPPLKNHKNTGFSSNTGPDPLKNRSCQPSIQCWAIIGPPAKRHLNGVSLVGR